VRFRFEKLLHIALLRNRSLLRCVLGALALAWRARRLVPFARLAVRSPCAAPSVALCAPALGKHLARLTRPSSPQATGGVAQGASAVLRFAALLLVRAPHAPRTWHRAAALASHHAVPWPSRGGLARRASTTSPASEPACSAVRALRRAARRAASPSRRQGLCAHKPAPLSAGEAVVCSRRAACPLAPLRLARSSWCAAGPPRPPRRALAPVGTSAARPLRRARPGRAVPVTSRCSLNGSFAAALGSPAPPRAARFRPAPCGASACANPPPSCQVLLW